MAPQHDGTDTGEQRRAYGGRDLSICQVTLLAGDHDAGCQRTQRTGVKLGYLLQELCWHGVIGLVFIRTGLCFDRVDALANRIDDFGSPPQRRFELQHRDHILGHFQVARAGVAAEFFVQELQAERNAARAAVNRRCVGGIDLQ